MQVVVTTENKVATVIQALQGVQTEETQALLLLVVTIGERWRKHGTPPRLHRASQPASRIKGQSAHPTTVIQALLANKLCCGLKRLLVLTDYVA
jgi:hypothetical protein